MQLDHGVPPTGRADGPPDRDALARAALTVAVASRERAVECALAAAAPPGSRDDVLRLAAALRATALPGVRLARAVVRMHGPAAGATPSSFATLCDARRAIGRALHVAHWTHRACARAADAEHVRARARATLALADAAAELASATLRLQSALGVRDATSWRDQAVTIASRIARAS
jgi:hypothetical protein